jgi:predicted HTH domain antitoxin
MQIQDIHIPASGLIRLSAGARLAGLTPEAMRAALDSQQIPIRRIQLGNLSFVRAAELITWLSPAPAPPAASADLFI